MPVNTLQHKSSSWVGMLYVALSAVAFGAMAIFIKIAYASGAETMAVLALRFSLAAVLMSTVMLGRGLRWPRGRNLLVLIGMGGLGYVGQSFCFFSSLNHASAGLAALLLYLYPVLVTLLGGAFFRQPLSRLQLGAVLTALVGTALTIGGDTSGTPLGIALGISAALIYAVYILVGSKMLQSEAPLPAATVVMLSAGTVLTALALIDQPALPGSTVGWLAIAAIAVISTVIAMVTFFAGLARISAADAATISTLEPLVTVLLAAIFLAELLGPAKLAGGSLILLALTVLARASQKKP
jgi:drug/metabolite transporter (DMT)-like permease